MTKHWPQLVYDVYCFVRICLTKLSFISSVDKSHGNHVVPPESRQNTVWDLEKLITFHRSRLAVITFKQKQPRRGRQRSIFIIFQKEKNKINASHIFLCIKWGSIGYICKMIKESFDLIYYGDTDRGWYIFNLLTETLQHPLEGLV